VASIRPATTSATYRLVLWRDRADIGEDRRLAQAARHPLGSGRYGADGAVVGQRGEHCLGVRDRPGRCLLLAGAAGHQVVALVRGPVPDRELVIPVEQALGERVTHLSQSEHG
jgi:hypothetical protein